MRRNNPRHQTLTQLTAIPHIDYASISLRDIKIEKESPISRKIKTITANDETLDYSPRFGTSLASIYGFSDSIFKYFDHEEVLNRIVERTGNDKINVAIQLNKEGNRTILAASRPTRDVIKADDLYDLFIKTGFDHGKVDYHNGVVISTHEPSKGKFKIASDELVDRFVIETPIDGYGDPSAYLGFLRLICSNGAVGYAKAFRSAIKLGAGKSKKKDTDGAIPTLRRFIDTYRNEEGFDALHKRLHSSLTSWASLDEMYDLLQLLSKNDMMPLHGNVNQVSLNNEASIPLEIETGRKTIYSSDLIDRLRTLGGDPQKVYGLLSLDSMSPKQRRKIPTKATMYDLINFTTQVATHRAGLKGHIGLSKRLNAWVGNKLSTEYDLEGTKLVGEDAEALFSINDVSIPELAEA